MQTKGLHCTKQCSTFVGLFEVSTDRERYNTECNKIGLVVEFL